MHHIKIKLLKPISFLSGCPSHDELNCTAACPNGFDGYEHGDDGCEECVCKGILFKLSQKHERQEVLQTVYFSLTSTL